MATAADELITIAHPRWIESGSVGIDPPTARRRVTPGAILLLVAGYAALEPLSRGLAVLEQPEGLTGVERNVDTTPRRQAGSLVAGLAEGLRVVA